MRQADLTVIVGSEIVDILVVPVMQEMLLVGIVHDEAFADAVHGIAQAQFRLRCLCGMGGDSGRAFGQGFRQLQQLARHSTRLALRLRQRREFRRRQGRRPRRIERSRNLGHVLQGPRDDSREKIRRRQNQDAEQDRGHGAAGLRQRAKARGRHRANHDGRKDPPAQAA